MNGLWRASPISAVRWNFQQQQAKHSNVGDCLLLQRVAVLTRQVRLVAVAFSTCHAEKTTATTTRKIKWKIRPSTIALVCARRRHCSAQAYRHTACFIPPTYARRNLLNCITYTHTQRYIRCVLFSRSMIVTVVTSRRSFAGSVSAAVALFFFFLSLLFI